LLTFIKPRRAGVGISAKGERKKIQKRSRRRHLLTFIQSSLAGAKAKKKIQERKRRHLLTFI
jgi:hypothetical protein